MEKEYEVPLWTRLLMLGCVIVIFGCAFYYDQGFGYDSNAIKRTFDNDLKCEKFECIMNESNDSSRMVCSKIKESD